MNAITKRIRRLAGRPDPFARETGLESIYRDLFLRELARLGDKDRFFPVGGAANYSLLYLVLRIGTELRPQSVLDIGAGQSTLLWSLLRRHRYVGDVLTLESDADWGTRIGAQVEHEVLVTPLADTLVAGRRAQTYDWDRAREGRRFDAVICDGPNGTPRHSRRGVLTLLDESLPDDFVLVIDDAERPGEQDTIAAVHARLQALDRSYQVGVVQAAKSQAVFATGRFLPATYL